jgi:hypothetical protein
LLSHPHHKPWKRVGRENKKEVIGEGEDGGVKNIRYVGDIIEKIILKLYLSYLLA